ncbi:MAG: hypothetical protein ACRDH6_01995 [Actinomycetota bacterium]
MTASLVIGLFLVPSLARAQGVHPLPGQKFEESKPWTFWLSFPVLLGAGGLVVLLGGSYVFLSRRFFGKEEIEPSKIRSPQLLGAAASRAMASAPAPAAAPAQPQAKPAAPAAEDKPAPEEKPAEEMPAAEAPAEQAAPEEKSAEEAPAAEAPAAAAPTHSGKAELDQDTFDRVLKEQLDKGAARPVAEGRARAAAVRAARQKAQGG